MQCSQAKAQVSVPAVCEPQRTYMYPPSELLSRDAARLLRDVAAATVAGRGGALVPHLSRLEVTQLLLEMILLEIVHLS